MSPSSVDPLFLELYPTLHARAHAMMRGERNGHTLETTALVHEAYEALCRTGTYGDLDAERLLRVAATAMRHALVDHARRRDSDKRGGDWRRVPLNDLVGAGRIHEDAVLRVHDLLEELRAFGAVAERQVLVFELHVFAGLTMEAISSLLDVSTREVYYDWAAIRAHVAARLLHE